MACNKFPHKMLAKTDVEKSTLDQQRSIWLSTLESYQHRFHVARENVMAKFHRQQQLVDQDLHNDFCFINQERLERDVVGLFDRYQSEIRALRRAENEREYANALERLRMEEEEVMRKHQSMFPLPTISIARAPEETPLRPTAIRPAPALARTAMVASPAEARSWSPQIQVSLPQDAHFREELYHQRHISSTRRPTNNAEFALRSDSTLSVPPNTMSRSHADLHPYETLATGRFHHYRDSASPGHALGPWLAEIDGRSERRIDQFRASEAKHDSSPNHVRSSQIVRHDHLMRIDDRSGQQIYRERNATASNNGYLQPAKSSNEKIEFDEVYQDGKAEFKHTIIKFSSKFYILKCDKHGVHFRQNALIAAAKHLNSALHGFLKKDFRQAIDLLGIRIVNCTDELAKLNNDCVRHAFEMGYKPMNLLRSRYDPRSRHDTPTPPPERGLSLPAVSHQTLQKEDVSEEVLNPKPGDLYWASCPKTNRTSVVMALGWKDLSMCGRDEMFCNLNLHKDMPRPRCYEFDNEGIIGWAAGYGEGESLVTSREVPVMRCESNGEDSFMWTSVRLLMPFRLDDPSQSFGVDAGELRTLQVYAGIRGFDSFESMLAHQAAEDPRQKHSSIVMKSHSGGTHSKLELPGIETHSPQRHALGMEVLEDDAVMEIRSTPSTSSSNLGDAEEPVRRTTESSCRALGHTVNVQRANLVCHEIRAKDSPAAPTPLNAEMEAQPEKLSTFETNSLPDAREETSSRSPAASVVSFLEQLRPGRSREEGIRTRATHAEHHADTIEVSLSPPNASSHQQPRLEADGPHPASTRARPRRQSQRAVVRQLRGRFMSADSHTSALWRK